VLSSINVSTQAARYQRIQSDGYTSLLQIILEQRGDGNEDSWRTVGLFSIDIKIDIEVTSSGVVHVLICA
jgi:hypothetical protein